jgi:hypothetical protein
MYTANPKALRVTLSHFSVAISIQIYSSSLLHTPNSMAMESIISRGLACHYRDDLQKEIDNNINGLPLSRAGAAGAHVGELCRRISAGGLR